jgi:hypothetical protein
VKVAVTQDANVAEQVLIRISIDNGTCPHPLAFAANTYLERRLPWNTLKSRQPAGLKAVIPAGAWWNGEMALHAPQSTDAGIYQVMVFYVANLSFGVVRVPVAVPSKPRNEKNAVTSDPAACL